MIVRMTDLYGIAVASDRVQFGHVHDFLLDLSAGVLRYLVLSPLTGDTNISLPMEVVAEPVTGATIEGLALGLTQEEVRDIAQFDLQSHPTRTIEAKLYTRLHWTPYWPPGEENKDCDLHAGREIMGLRVQASDGTVGHLDDLMVVPGTWAIWALVMNTEEVLQRDAALAPWQTVTGCDWQRQCLSIAVSRKQVEMAPVWDQHQPYSEAQMSALRTHFERFRD